MTQHAAPVVDRVMTGLGSRYPDLSHAWRVEGSRTRPDGSVETMVDSAFGQTEERARAFWHRVRSEGVDKGWRDADLTFSREESR